MEINYVLFLFYESYEIKFRTKILLLQYSKCNPGFRIDIAMCNSLQRDFVPKLKIREGHLCYISRNSHREDTCSCEKMRLETEQRKVFRGKISNASNVHIVQMTEISGWVC